MMNHSVLIISFNQESYIENTIKSVITQDPKPLEIIIGDDCSTDNTWEIIRKYQNQFPTIIKCYRNVKNLGNIKNFNKIKKMPQGDIISCLGGDDYLKPNMLYNINLALEKHSLKKSDSYIIITNTSMLLPSHKEIVFDNYKYRNYLKKDLIKEKLRFGISIRDIGLSNKLFMNLSDLVEDYGISADLLFSIEPFIVSNYFFFIPEISSVYRTSIGMVSKTNEQLFYSSRLKVLDHLKNTYKDIWDRKDLNYIKFLKAKSEYFLDKNSKKLLNYIFNLIKNCRNFSSNHSFEKEAILLVKQIFKNLKKRI